MLTLLQKRFFFTILTVTGLIAVAVFFSYFSTLCLAIIAAVVFRPLYVKIQSHMMRYKGTASFITVILVSIAFAVPIALIAFLLFQEISDGYEYLINGGGDIVLIDYLAKGQNFINTFLPGREFSAINLSDVRNWLDTTAGWILGSASDIFYNSFFLLSHGMVFVLAFFFFLRDGDAFKAALIRLSPIEDIYDKRIIQQVKNSIKSIVQGTILIAIFQGLAAMVGFWILGVPSPILWGLITIIASLIPSLGTFVVIVPAVIFLFFAKGIVPAAILLAWGVFIVGLIDNILKPFVLEKGTNIHPFLILISVLGGISLFGVSGLVLGPIVVSLLLALSDVYVDLRNAAREKKGIIQ